MQERTPTAAPHNGVAFQTLIPGSNLDMTNQPNSSRCCGALIGVLSLMALLTGCSSLAPTGHLAYAPTPASNSELIENIPSPPALATSQWLETYPVSYKLGG